MKTILVLVGGGETDDAVLKTAHAAARPLGSHLEMVHVKIDPGEAALFTPHVEFARGPALREALGHLRLEADARSEKAKRDFDHFCAEQSIALAAAPADCGTVTAIWQEERDEAVTQLMRRARHNDLVVLGRPKKANGLPPDLAELLLVGSGRPLLIAPPRARQRVTGTVLLCWKETAATARALGAALPFLIESERVVVAGIEEGVERSPEGLQDVARHLAWHGVAAEIEWLAAETQPIPERLEAVAARCDADLLVMGGYSHSRMRETIFGGCTRHFLDHAERPVLLMH